jgi:hypothetical protein
MLTPEYLRAVRERALRNNPSGKTDPDCTCASCARLILLEQVERYRAQEAEREAELPPIKDTIGGQLASAVNADAYGKAMGHAFRAAELAYDAGARDIIFVV